MTSWPILDDDLGLMAVPVVGSDMLRLQVFYFYRFGATLSQLHDLALSQTPLDDWKWGDRLERAQKSLHNFSTFSFGNDKRLPLPKSQKGALDLLGVVEPLITLVGTDRKLEKDEWLFLSDRIIDFQNIFQQELADSHTYFVHQMGAYSITALVDDARSHLSQPARDMIGEKPKDDYDLAGKSLAFDMFTACGFHAMRALEAVARNYHKQVTGAAKEVDWTLDSLINGNSGRSQFGLRDQWKEEGARDDSPLALIMALLSSVNQIYRNPIMHPEMTLRYETAKQVFDVAAIAISAMAADIIERLPKALTAGPP